LQFFNEFITEREIVSALKAVLMKEKSLVLLLPNTPELRLVPVEYDTNWESRMSDMLEPLKVSTEGYSDWDGETIKTIIVRFHEWLYESEGLEKLLKPYVFKPGLFWVCSESELAVDAISRISGKLQKETIRDIGKHYAVQYLIDEKGIKLEALSISTYYDKAKYKRAALIHSWSVQLNMLGVVDPIPNLATHTPKREGRKEIKIKRVRRDAVTSNIHKYLKSCTSSNTSVNIDDCWNFLAKELDIHSDGYLIWYSQRGEAKHTNKEQVSGRFNEALKDYTSK